MIHITKAMKISHLVQTLKSQASKVHNLVQILWKKFHPNWVSSRCPFVMMSVELKYVFKPLPCPLYLHICTSFSFMLPRGRLMFLDSSYKGRYHIHMVGCSKTPIDQVLNNISWKQWFEANFEENGAYGI